MYSKMWCFFETIKVSFLVYILWSDGVNLIAVRKVGGAGGLWNFWNTILLAGFLRGGGSTYMLRYTAKRHGRTTTEKRFSSFEFELRIPWNHRKDHIKLGYKKNLSIFQYIHPCRLV